MSEVIYNSDGLNRLAIAVIEDAVKVVKSKEYGESRDYYAHHAAAWLETTGLEWADILGIGINRQGFACWINHQMGMREVSAILRNLSEVYK